MSTVVGMCVIPWGGTVHAETVDVYGVRAAAQELPSVYGLLRRPGDSTGSPLDQSNDITSAFQAYLDTGTSGIVLSNEYAAGDALDVQRELDSSLNPVSFSDIAVGGVVTYDVSEKLDLRIGRYTGEVFNDVFATAQTNAYFNQTTPGVRLQVSRTPVDPILGTPLNLIGMPALKDKVMVVDARLYNHIASVDLNTLEVHYTPDIESLADFPSNNSDVPLPQIQTWVYDKNDATNHSATPLFDPGAPASDHVIKMSYGDFSRFTETTPNEPGVEAPVLAHNPFIGPAPFGGTPLANDPPGVKVSRSLSVSHNVVDSTGSWLFDSGAQISFMSSAQALALGIELTFDPITGDPKLTDLETGGDPAGLFDLPIAGAGGDSGTLLGFTLDSLTLPTTDGSIVFHDIPIVVLDVTVSDGVTEYTLDGDIGMNLFLPTFDPTGDNSTSSQFDFFAFDEAAGELRLTNSTVAVPEPVASVLVIASGTIFMRRRRR